MNEKDIALALANGPFPYRRYLCVPNLSWGFLNWEADFAAIAPSGYLYEVEIKVSVHDLKRDAHKTKHRARDWDKKVRALSYAMPLTVWERVCECPPIPDHAGVFVIHHERVTMDQVQRIRMPKLNRNAVPLTPAQQYQCARLGTMRYWTRYESVAA